MTIFRFVRVGMLSCVATASLVSVALAQEPFPGGQGWPPGYGPPGYYGREMMGPEGMGGHHQGMGHGPAAAHGPCVERGGMMRRAEGGDGPAEAGQMAGRAEMARHMMVMRQGVPESYRNLENPVAPTRVTLTEGEKLYATNCQSCHGEAGAGNGPDGKALTPRPANLYRTLSSPMASDSFLFWAISEGGEPVGSKMKAFKGILSEDQIWKIITFLRAGMPVMADRGDKAR